jgi:hypothetical protein
MKLRRRAVIGLAIAASGTSPPSPPPWRRSKTRIYAGFHFRFSCNDAATLGALVANYITGTLMQPLRQRRPATPAT